MARKKYVYREGARIKGSVTAEDVGKTLERIRKRDGALRTEAVVAEATPEESEIHAAFTWEDEVAAHSWRLQEARILIRAVHVVIDDQPARAAYIHVPRIAQVEGEYQTPEIVKENVDMFTLALKEAEADLAAAQRRVAELKRLAEGEPDRLAMLTLASQALSTAENAIRAMH